MQLMFITPDHPLYAQELELRYRVLRQPLGHARADVPFPFERESLHLVLCEGGSVLGCVLFHPEDARSGRLFQMAIAAEQQGRGLGRDLVRALEEELQRRGFVEVHLHARAPVAAFYERLGYELYGEPFVEVGVAHVLMRRSLDRGTGARVTPAR
jgi:predicted GNAT family N-acyltransferase